MNEPRPSGQRRRIRLPRLIPATVVVVLLLFLASYLVQRRHAAASAEAPADTSVVPAAQEPHAGEDAAHDGRREGVDAERVLR